MKKLKSEVFKYKWDLIDWVNEKPNVQVVSITSAARADAAYILFYYEL